MPSKKKQCEPNQSEMTEEALEKQLLFSSFGSQAGTWEEVMCWLSREAGDAFMRGDDALAKKLREMSKGAGERGVSLRKSQKEYE